MQELGKMGRLVQPSLGWRWLLLLAGLTLLFSQAQPVLAKGFTATTGSMGTIRQYHTATLLDDGRVLIAGGKDVNGTLRSAEIYDPVTGSFTATSANTGGMTVARQSHTASKLPNGKVLITGGYSGSAYLATAEIFDPAGNGGAGTFTATDSMDYARSDHAATPISGNRVLITGGQNGSVLNTAEIFDPAGNGGAGTFTATGPMSTARRLHTATRLGDGRVLVAGGTTSTSISSSSTNITDKAEIYSPAADATGSFTQVINLMISKRREHTATLLNSGKVLIAGGLLSSNYLASAEIFDPATGAAGAGTFTATASPMAIGHGNHTAILLPSGKVLVAGGNTGSTLSTYGPTSSAEIFNTAGGNFGSTAMTSARAFHAAVAFTDGRVLLAGGNDPFIISNSAEIYDPASIAATPSVFRFEDYYLDVDPPPTPQTQSFTISNSGSSPLTLNSIGISPDVTNFTITANSCGSSLAASGGSCSVSVTFNPPTSGNKSAELVINSTDPEKPVMSILLTGRGIGAFEPDLAILKTHSGSLSQGQTGAQYMITVTNSGNAPTSGTVTVTDALPAGLTATNMSGEGWTCASLTCTRSDVLYPDLSYPAITLTVNVSSTAPATIVNTATVSGGGESNSLNNTASDPASVLQFPDLTITKSHSGNFRQGDTGKAYTITVSNSGYVQTLGTVTVVDTLPVGLTATAISGTGWACSLGTLTCTRSDALTAGASFPPITVTVNVANNAQASVTNTVAVSGGGQLITTNDTASDVTAITQVADLTVTKTHIGNFMQGDTGKTYTITVNNAGSGPTAGQVTVTDTLPGGLTATAITGTGWTCSTLTSCSRSDILAAGSSYPALTLTVSVAGNAPASVTNSATVSGGGQLNMTNDSANDPTGIDPAIPYDLTLTLAGSGSGSISINASTNPEPLLTCGASCSTQVDSGATVTLQVATLDQYSLFKGWSGACTNLTGDCVFVMTGAKSATAAFDIDYPNSVLIETPSAVHYPSIKEAYAAAPDNAAVLMWGVSFPGDLVLDQAKTVTLDGGYNRGYTGYSGNTMVNGKVTIAKGKVIAGRFVIK